MTYIMPHTLIWTNDPMISQRHSTLTSAPHYLGRRTGADDGLGGRPVVDL